jgi:hypothetical protein
MFKKPGKDFTARFRGRFRGRPERGLFPGIQFVLPLDGRAPETERTLLDLRGLEFEFFSAMIAKEPVGHGALYGFFKGKFHRKDKRLETGD